MLTVLQELASEELKIDDELSLNESIAGTLYMEWDLQSSESNDWLLEPSKLILCRFLLNVGWAAELFILGTVYLNLDLVMLEGSASELLLLDVPAWERELLPTKGGGRGERLDT